MRFASVFEILLRINAELPGDNFRKPCKPAMQKLKPYDRQEFKAFADNLAAQNATTLKFRELNLKFTPLAAADKISRAKLR
ncbi:hypothetical protein [uncultured Campylobacter sp.]|uniref:hypothetical protein n=1 Tax=uncultured Campylobacter sp. TaxID=218934 RepID=UPI0026396574|nr:hypothetical protein [uncultured Campylobacter sp.]